MTRLQRIVIWLNTGDNAFHVICFACAPLLALCVIGMAGNGGA